MSSRHSGAYRFIATAAGVLALFALPAMAITFPNGPTDGICTPQAVGPTTCIVFEGMGDTLEEEFVNLTPDPILVDQLTAGGITYISGDPTDVITSDPVSDINCVGNVLAPNGGFCFFDQSFGTGPETGSVPPVDMGVSSMSFNLLLTDLAGANFPNAFVAPCPASLQINGLAPCITLLDAGADPVNGGELYGLNITSAIVTVNDVIPEPSSIVLFGTGLAALGAAFKRLRR
jgi:hypothetical protein